MLFYLFFIGNNHDDASASDAPRISCRTASAVVGDKDTAIICHVLSKPRASLVFWQIVADDDHTTRLSGGEHNQLYWATVSVRYLFIYLFIC